MRIEVLGPGCPRCETLVTNVRSAVTEMGLDAEVTKVTDINEITARGVMMTPAIAVDGEVRSSGKVLSAEEIQALLS